MIPLIHPASESSSYSSYASEIILPNSHVDNCNPCGNMAVQAFFPETAGRRNVRIAETFASAYYRWPNRPIAETPAIQQYIILGKGELSGSSNVATASFSDLTCMETDSEREFIGVFSVSHHRRILHSEEITINISKLHRRQPNVQINLNLIPDDDE